MGWIGNAPSQGLFNGGQIVDGSIGTVDIADSAVTAAKLASAAITDKLGYTPVTPTQLAAKVNKTGDTITGPLVVDTGYQNGLRVLRDYNVVNSPAGAAIQMGAKLGSNPVYPIEIIGITDQDGTAYGVEVKYNGSTNALAINKLGHNLANRFRASEAFHHGTNSYWKSRDNSGGADFVLEYATNDTLNDVNIRLALSNAGDLRTSGQIRANGAGAISGAKIVARAGGIAATNNSNESNGCITFAARIGSGTNFVIAQATGIDSGSMVTAKCQYINIYDWSNSTIFHHGERMAAIRSSSNGNTTANNFSLGSQNSGSTSATEPSLYWTGTSTLNLNLTGAGSNEGIAMITIAWRGCAMSISPST
jgi:hypothetical protein